MRKESTTTKEIIIITLSIFGIILTIIKRDIETLIWLIILTISTIIILILILNLKKIDTNTKDIEKIKKNFITSERLNKLELTVFKK